MRHRTLSVLTALGAALTLAATAGAQQQQPPAPKHHSKLKGAIVGGAAGHMVGHGKMGAAAGALYQHHKNKKQGT